MCDSDSLAQAGIQQTMVTFPAVAVKIEETFRQSVVMIKKITGLRASHDMLPGPDMEASVRTSRASRPFHRSRPSTSRPGSLGTSRGPPPQRMNGSCRQIAATAAAWASYTAYWKAPGAGRTGVGVGRGGG